MIQDLQQSVIRILNPGGATVGTGFVVANHLAVTCRHIIRAAGSDSGQPIEVQFLKDGRKQVALLLPEGWSSSEDVAFLLLERLPTGIVPVVLGTANECAGHSYSALGCSSLMNYEMSWAHNDLNGIFPVENRRPMLLCKGEKIEPGLDGAPVLDLLTNRVVGMLSKSRDSDLADFAWATTSDTLVALKPTLKLWPDAYGPAELNVYLDYLIDANHTLMLPDGNEVQLEQVYVSLRADEMNAAEREAEHDLYLEDAASLQKVAEGTGSDNYARFEAMRKAITRHPKMLMLEARNWSRLFGEREISSQSLTEVMQQHTQVVLLGDPGSGKTTLGKWLVLQFARALRQGKFRVQIRADSVRPGDTSNRLIDLGPVRLPVFIRIVDYAHARWDKERGDTQLPLGHFLSLHPNQKIWPPQLTPEGVGALVQDYLSRGLALVVLDGLDEVADPLQRRIVMQAVKHFIQTQPALSSEEEGAGNRVLLTSRIVGYQFAPLTYLPHYTLEEMDETAIIAFCHLWMMAVAGVEEAAEQAEKLIKSIFDHSHPSVRALAGNPLLLTILAQVYWTNTERALPTSRPELFDAVTQALYDQRRDFWSRAGIPLPRLTRALGAVAAYIHAFEVTGFAEEGSVRAQLVTVLIDPEQVEAILAAARDVSGVLVARGEGVYGFLHRSLQEYFAARHLAAQPEQVSSNLATRLFDSLWREPVVLAVGIVSQPGYPDGLRHLAEIFDVLLNAPDPTGDILPRRELLAINACAECQRVPREIAQGTVEHLLTFYAKRRGHGKLSVLIKRVLRAFETLRDSGMRDQTEAVLLDALEAQDSKRRYAAVDIVIETKWNSPSVACALVMAWRAYADPAALLLIALDEMSEDHPTFFQPSFLSLRSAMIAEPLLWEKAETNQQWRAIIRLLYLPQGAYFRPEMINRDSPLTEHLLELLRQPRFPDLPDQLQAFKEHLVQLAIQPGSALARDAALILSVLGDESWVTPSVANADSQGRQICPIAVSLALSLPLALAHDLYLDLVRDYTPARALALASELVHNQVLNSDQELDNNLALALTYARNLALARDLISTIDLARSRAGEVTDKLSENHSRALTRTLNQAFADALDLACRIQHVRTLAHSLARVLARAHSLASDLELAGYIDLARAHANVLLLTRAPTFDSMHRPDLTRTIDLALSGMNDLTPNLELLFTRHHHFDHDGAYDYNDARDLELVLANDLKFASAITDLNAQANEIKQYIQMAQVVWKSDIKLASSLNSAFSSVQNMQKAIAASTQVAQILSTLMVACRQRWPAKPDLVISSTLPERLTVESLATLIADLASSNDVQRERAQRMLMAKRLVSDLGQQVIEQMAKLLNKYEDDYLIGSRLTLALSGITYDTPSWITQWIEQAGSAHSMISIETILSTIHRVTPEAFDVILAALPNASYSVNTRLLASLSWLARLGQIPKRKQYEVRKRLFDWLDQEIESDTRCAIIKVLGHLQEDAEFIGGALLVRLNRSALESDLPAFYGTLARLAARQPNTNLAASILKALRAGYPQPDAIAGLVRLSLEKILEENNLQRQKGVMNTRLLSELANILPDASHCLTGLLGAGADDDIWNDEYHGILANAICSHVELHADLLPSLLAKLQETLSDQNWPARRIALAAVAACTEVMPMAVQWASGGSLESLLVKGATDAESFNSRSFALTALSYLRTVTPAVVPALLAGCRDIEAVQRNTIAAASRFQYIEGDLLPSLIAALTDESVSTSYAITQLLGALSVSAAGEATGFRQRIIEGLVNVLRDPSSQREVIISGENKGKLEDALYAALLQAAHWTG